MIIALPSDISWASLFERDMSADGPAAMAAQTRALAHALGNPLAGLSLSLELLAQAPSEQARVRHITRCQRATDRLIAMQKEWSALATGAEVPGFVSNDALVQHALAPLGQTISLASPFWHAEPQNAQLWGRPIALALALRELISNAHRASGAGQWGIRMGAQADGGSLCVWDRGPGVPEHRRPALFSHVPSHTSANDGLGLMRVAYIVVRLHAGRVGHRPHPGGGSEFWWWLPPPPKR